jgi:hypothetical protein
MVPKSSWFGKSWTSWRLVEIPGVLYCSIVNLIFCRKWDVFLSKENRSGSRFPFHTVQQQWCWMRRGGLGTYCWLSLPQTFYVQGSDQTPSLPLLESAALLSSRKAFWGSKHADVIVDLNFVSLGDVIYRVFLLSKSNLLRTKPVATEVDG